MSRHLLELLRTGGHCGQQRLLLHHLLQNIHASNMDSSSSPLSPSIPPELSRAAAVIRTWAVMQHSASENQVRLLLQCMNRGFLASRPKLAKSRALPEQPSNKNYRQLYYRNAAAILGWGPARRREGEGHGFSEEVYEQLRSVVFPDAPDGVTNPASDHHIVRGGRAIPELHQRTEEGEQHTGLCGSQAAPRSGSSQGDDASLPAGISAALFLFLVSCDTCTPTRLN